MFPSNPRSQLLLLHAMLNAPDSSTRPSSRCFNDGGLRANGDCPVGLPAEPEGEVHLVRYDKFAAGLAPERSRRERPIPGL